MFTHIFVGANDVAKSKAFYDAALGALGHTPMPIPDGVVYASDAGRLIVRKPRNGEPATFGNGHTLGLQASDYEAVDAFHAQGLAAGGSCDGAPGFRANAPGNAYGAYLRDPDGNKICAFAPNVGEKG